MAQRLQQSITHNEIIFHENSSASKDVSLENIHEDSTPGNSETIEFNARIRNLPIEIQFIIVQKLLPTIITINSKTVKNNGSRASMITLESDRMALHHICPVVREGLLTNKNSPNKLSFWRAFGRPILFKTSDILFFQDYHALNEFIRVEKDKTALYPSLSTEGIHFIAIKFHLFNKNSRELNNDFAGLYSAVRNVLDTIDTLEQIFIVIDTARLDKIDEISWAFHSTPGILQRSYDDGTSSLIAQIDRWIELLNFPPSPTDDEEPREAKNTKLTPNFRSIERIEMKEFMRCWG